MQLKYTRSLMKPNLPLTTFMNQWKSIKIYLHFAATLQLNFSHTGR